MAEHHSDEPARHTLRLVATHVVARARQQATGRFSLRVTPGGFGTPEFGPEPRRVRVSGGSLVVESDASGAASTRASSIDGSTLRQLAELAGVDLTEPLDVGHDTPPLGDVDGVLELDVASARRVAEWDRIVALALDIVCSQLPASATPSLVRLWPEHFDVAVDLDASPEVRVNLGGSAGDGFSAEPYLYVGPWTDDRPGDGEFWNAPFGAALVRSQLDPADPAGSAAGFLLEGFARFGA